MQNLFRILLFLLVSTPVSQAEIPAKRPLTPRDIACFREIAQPQISADGQWVAFVLSDTVEAPDGRISKNSDIWIVAADGTIPPRKFAFGPGSENMPRWSPDGKSLAFLSDRGNKGTPQIFVMPAAGGEAETLTRLPGGVMEFKWHPDSRNIGCLTRDSRPTNVPILHGKAADVFEYESDFHPQRLYEIDSETGTSSRLFAGEENVNSFEYSPDGAKVLLSFSTTPLTDDIVSSSRLGILFRKNNRLQKIPCACVGTSPSSTSMSWTPDGNRFLYFTYISPETALPSLFSLEKQSSELLAGKFKGFIWELQWLPDAESILVSAQVGVQGTIGKLDLSSGKVTFIKNVYRRYWSGPTWNYHARQKTIVFIDASEKTAEDLWIMKADGTEVRRLTNMNPETADISFGEQEAVKWKSRDDREIEGVLIKPPGFDGKKTYPLVVLVHGGPVWSWWLGWYGNWHEWGAFLASNGYLVLLPNSRGSDGYGLDFIREIRNDWGGKDFQDVLTGVDFLISKKNADPRRIGIGGWSYGGFLSAWATGRSSVFKASVMGAGVYDLPGFFGTMAVPSVLKYYFNGNPYDKKQNYERRSPIAFAKNIKAPTLLFHGKEDQVVPLSQSLEFYRALKEAGVKTRLYVFPSEGHEMTDPNNQIFLLERVLEWFDIHLQVDRSRRGRS
jgi:dipeptidyl aminopeptidase/acylaminoacyl peptidase